MSEISDLELREEQKTAQPGSSGIRASVRIPLAVVAAPFKKLAKLFRKEPE